MMNGFQIISTAAVATCIIYFINRHTNDDYIVSGKGAKKIIYYPIKNPNDIHVMDFDGDTTNYYPYIHVGDTIWGTKGEMNQPISRSRVDGSSTISRLNGKRLPELRKIAQRDSMYARRDSLINAIRQRVK